MTPVEQLHIREPGEIKFGAIEPETTYHVCRIYEWLTIPFGTVRDFKTDDHHAIYDLLDMLIATFSKIEGETAVWEPATNINQECVFMNLGRLARKKITGVAYNDTITNLVAELCKSGAGVTKVDNDHYAERISQLWFVIGADLKEYIGEWNTTTYKKEDECLGGIMITLKYLVTMWDLHCISMHTLIRDIGEYVSDGGLTRGTYKTFDGFNETTWGSAILQLENAIGNMFGIQLDWLDNNVIRGIDIPVVDGAFGLAQKLLSRTRWTWRYGRWLEVVPIYSLWSPSSSIADGDRVMYNLSPLHTGLSQFLLNGFSDDGADVKYRTFLNGLVHLISRIKTFWFKNKSLAKLKEQYSTVKFFDLPTLGLGFGGILHHQMAYWHTNTRNTLTSKLYMDQLHSSMDTLQLRRVTDQNLCFQIIGDVPLDIFLLNVGLNVISVRPSSLANSSVAICMPLMYPHSGIIIGITKNEDEPYRMVATEITDACEFDHEANEIGFMQWNDSGFPCSMLTTKSDYYAMRSEDPYKKLAHRVYDVNNFDIENMRQIMLSAFGYSGGSVSVETAQIPVSAMIDKRDDDTLKPNTAGAPMPPAVSAIPVVSAIPADIKAKIEEKKEEKKDAAK